MADLRVLRSPSVSENNGPAIAPRVGVTLNGTQESIIEKALTRLVIALEARKGDPRLAEYRAVALHHEHDR